MATRSDYRDALIIKLRDAANAAGRTEFTSPELNDMLANAPRRLFPYLYELTEAASTYASDSSGRVDLTTAPAIDATTVAYVYDDGDELVSGWGRRGTTKLTGLPASETGLQVVYMQPLSMPADDITTVDIADQYFEMIVLQAAIIGIETFAAKKVKFRGYQAPGTPGENEVLNLHDALKDALDRELQSKGMTLPEFGV